MAHREGIRKYLEEVEVYGTVIDWGCGTKPIMNYLKENNARFINVDKVKHEQVNAVADIEQPITLEPADFAFCLEVIEHTWNVVLLLENIHRNLKKGGFLYLSQPFMYLVHKEDDRIRFTYHGLRQILTEASFKVEDIQPTEGDLDHASGYIVRCRK